jgi:tetratricopeptide (TPR) repeat protein
MFRQAIVLAGFTLLIRPASAIAQHEAFVGAVSELTSALPGTYGDEAAAARAALDRMERGLTEWDKTLREYESNLLTIGPTAPAARQVEMRRAMGLLYMARGRFTEAALEFDAAAPLSSEPKFRLFSGAAQEAAGRPADALKAHRAAWMLDPGNPVAAYALAAYSFRSGAPPPKELLSTLSDVVDRIAAKEYASEPEPFVATALFPDDLTDTPMFVPSWYSSAYTHLERAEYAQALRDLRAAVAQDPLLAAPPPAALLRGAEALRSGQVAIAVDRFAEAVRDTPSSETHRMLGVAYWLSADDERGIDHLERAVRLNPRDERAGLMLARVLEDIGEAGRAERVLTETAAAIPLSAMARSRLGRLHAANRIQDAVREYEAALRIGALSGKAPLLLEIADLYRRELDYERSEAAFARAVALRPNDAVAHRERGRALLQLERPEAGLAELAAALLIDAEDYESYLLIGQLHLEAGRYPQAIRLMTRAIAIDPGKPGAYYTLATALARSGRADEAAPYREAFEKRQAAVSEEQRRRFESSTSRLAASVMNEKGEFERAAAAWTRILADGHGDNVDNIGAANHAGLAAALAGLGQFDAAAEQYEKALALDATATVYRALAALYDRIGRSDAAARTRARLARRRQMAFGLTVPPR